MSQHNIKLVPTSIGHYNLLDSLGVYDSVPAATIGTVVAEVPSGTVVDSFLSDKNELVVTTDNAVTMPTRMYAVASMVHKDMELSDELLFSSGGGSYGNGNGTEVTFAVKDTVGTVSAVMFVGNEQYIKENIVSAIAMVKNTIGIDIQFIPTGESEIVRYSDAFEETEGGATYSSMRVVYGNVLMSSNVAELTIRSNSDSSPIVLLPAYYRESKIAINTSLWERIPTGPGTGGTIQEPGVIGNIYDTITSSGEMTTSLVDPILPTAVSMALPALYNEVISVPLPLIAAGYSTITVDVPMKPGKVYRLYLQHSGDEGEFFSSNDIRHSHEVDYYAPSGLVDPALGARAALIDDDSILLSGYQLGYTAAATGVISGEIKLTAPLIPPEVKAAFDANTLASADVVNVFGESVELANTLVLSYLAEHIDYAGLDRYYGGSSVKVFIAEYEFSEVYPVIPLSFEENEFTKSVSYSGIFNPIINRAVGVYPTLYGIYGEIIYNLELGPYDDVSITPQYDLQNGSAASGIAISQDIYDNVNGVYYRSGVLSSYYDAPFATYLNSSSNYYISALGRNGFVAYLTGFEIARKVKTVQDVPNVGMVVTTYDLIGRFVNATLEPGLNLSLAGYNSAQQIYRVVVGSGEEVLVSTTENYGVYVDSSVVITRDDPHGERIVYHDYYGNYDGLSEVLSEGVYVIALKGRTGSQWIPTSISFSRTSV